MPPTEPRRGGWFVMYADGRDWSGPWATEEAAKLARDGFYEMAHAAELSVAPNKPDHNHD